MPRYSHVIGVLLLLCYGYVKAAPADQNRNADQTFHTYTTIDPANPPKVFQQIQSGIQEIAHFRADFREEKNLSALSRTVRNRGYVLFDREQGLYRHVSEPLKTQQLITRDGLVVEKSPEHERRKRLKPGSAPRLFLDSLYLVFSGRFSDFDGQFKIEMKLEDGKNNDQSTDDSDQHTSKQNQTQHWFLRLTPEGKKMKNFFSRMIIEGNGKRLKSFSMHRDNGDTTRTTFSNVTYTEQLSGEQKSRFRAMKDE